MSSLLEPMYKKMKEYGLEKKDFRKCAVCYGIMTTGVYVGTVFMLYRYRPFHVLRNNPTFQKKFPWVERMDNKIHQYRIIKNISENFSEKPKEFSKALVEGIIIGKVFSPILFPLEIGGTVYCVKKMKEHQESNLAKDEVKDEVE